MAKNFDDVQKLGLENADTAARAFGAISNHVQTIATEVADYSKKSFEETTKLFEQMMATKSFETAVELQQSYFKNAYEGFVAEVTKIGGLYVDLAKETCRPLQGYAAKSASLS